jgi:site-specific DNA recombinase
MSSDTRSERGALPKAVIYLRVSSPGQVKKDYDREGLSLPAQRQACMRKAEALGAVVVEEFVEPGVSGGSIQKRKAFRKMLKFIAERGDIDYVIVWSVSRWARDQEDHWVARGLIRRAGARLVSVKEQIGGETSSEIVMEGVMAAVAAGRRLDIAEDVRRGLLRKAEVGGTPFRAPIGYVNVTKIIDGHEVRDVVPDPERMALITEIFQLYATDRYTLEELAALMEARGLRSRATSTLPAAPLTPNRLSELLRNEYYLGVVTIKGKPFQGRHQPLVTPVVFERCQEILEGRRRNGARAWRHHHYLAGTLFCGGCGARLLYNPVTNRHGKLYEYYFCIGKQHGSCAQPYHRLEDVEAAVQAFYDRVSLSGDEREALREELLDRLEKLADCTTSDAEAADRTLMALGAQEQKLLQAFYADSIRPELFHAEQKRIRRERIAAEQVKERLQTDLAVVEENVALAVELMADPGEAYRRADPRLRGLMNSGFFQALYVDNGEVAAGDLQPVLQQLAEVWVEIEPRFSPRQRRQATDVARRQPCGWVRPQELRNPQARRRGGSKVEGMVRLRGLEPPRGLITPHGPEPCASASSATAAGNVQDDTRSRARHAASGRAVCASARRAPLLSSLCRAAIV